MTGSFEIWGYQIPLKQVVVEVIVTVMIAFAGTTFNYVRTRLAEISRNGRIEKYKDLKRRYSLACYGQENIMFRTTVMLSCTVSAIKQIMKFLALLALFLYLWYATSDWFLLKHFSQHHHAPLPKSAPVVAEMIFSLTVAVVLGFCGHSLVYGFFFINKAVEMGSPFRSTRELKIKLSKVRMSVLRTKRKLGRKKGLR